MENPPTEKTRKRKDEDEEEKPRWKMTTNIWTSPTPSIAKNTRNMKTTFPSVFARRTSQ